MNEDFEILFNLFEEKLSEALGEESEAMSDLAAQLANIAVFYYKEDCEYSSEGEQD